MRCIDFLLTEILHLDVDCSLASAPAYLISSFLFFSLLLQVHGMLSQMDPALVAYCDKIASQGGPVQLSDELEDSTFPASPVVQLGTGIRMSARLRHVQPEVNVDKSYEALKRTKKITEMHTGMRHDSHEWVDICRSSRFSLLKVLAFHTLMCLVMLKTNIIFV